MSSSFHTFVLRLSWALSLLPVFGGLCLLGLLPIGIFGSISGHWFQYLFLFQAAVMLFAALASLWVFLRLTRASRWPAWFPLVTAGLVLICIIINAGLPITSRDALIHHLAVPKWWVEADRIMPIAWHEWSFYPMLLNLSFTGFISQGLDWLTPYYHALFLITACGLVSLFIVRRTDDPELAVIGYLFGLSLPVCFRLSGEPLVDLGLVLYIGIALCHLLYWAEGDRRNRHVWLAGISLGLALGTKYNAILAVGMVFLLLPVLLRGQPGLFGNVFKSGFVLAGAAFLVFSPWLIKNLFWTGNPVYPLYGGLFGTADIDIGVRSLKPIEHRLRLYGENWTDILALPFRMMLFGADDNPRRFDGVLSPLLLLGFLPLIRARRQPWVWFLGLYCFGYFVLAVSMSSARIRYMAPLFFPATVLCLAGVYFAAALFKRETRLIIYAACIGLHLFLSFFYIGQLLHKNDAVAWLGGKLNKPHYLSKHIPEYELIQYVNSHLPKNDYVFALFTGNPFYYFDGKVISGGYFSGRPILGWLKASKSSRLLAIEFKNRGIGFLFVHAKRTKESFESMLSTDEVQAWNEFQRQYLSLVHVSSEFSLWRINQNPVETASQ